MNPIISITNYIKVAAIILADLMNKIYNPFQMPPSYDPVSDPAKLETLFYADAQARFFQPTGEFLYELPRPADAGDTALFQGLATAMKIMRNADTLKERFFIHSLFPNGSLVRGFYADGTPNDTTSNDSATGMLFFFYTAFMYGDSDTRDSAGAILRTWANNLRAHNWALCDLKGTPTQYGQLEQGWKTDPLRITLLLGILFMASAYDKSFSQDYIHFYNLYHPILAYPKVSLLWWGKDYDTHRAAIHLHVLYQMTKDPIYKKGLLRIARITEREDNAWVYTLCSVAMDKPDGSIVKRRLATFDFNRRQLGTVESLNPGVPSVKWGNDVRAKYALPFYQRGSQEFFWQRCMFSKNEWIAKNWPQPYHSGLDFLICGWLASRLGLI